MWILKKKWQALEKRVADLEGKVQSQQEVKIDAKAIRQNLRKLESRTGFLIDGKPIFHSESHD